MTIKTISQQHSAAPSWKVAALIAFALAMGLLAWRAKHVVMPAGQDLGALSPSEITLFQMLEPIVGAANLRVAIVDGAEAGRTATVLINESAGSELTRVRMLAKQTLAMEPARGDTLSVETAAFFPGAGGAISLLDYIELCGLVLVSGLTGWIALRPQTLAQPETIAMPVHVETERPRDNQTVVPMRRPIEPAADPLVSVATSDPARAANVLRDWMSTEEGQR